MPRMPEDKSPVRPYPRPPTRDDLSNLYMYCSNGLSCSLDEISKQHRSDFLQDTRQQKNL